MSSVRQQRVCELLKREIGEAVRREFLVSEAGLLTVNDVVVAGDMKSATVYVSILGSAAQQKHGLALLHQRRARIQNIVGKAVVLKYTPTLKFVVDDSLERGNKILQIIEDLEKTAPPDPPAATGAPKPEA